MRSNPLPAILLSTLLALSSNGGTSSAPAYRCQLKVTDASDRPVPGASAELYAGPVPGSAEKPGASPVERRATDAAGTASFTVTNQGMFTVIVSKPGSSLAWGIWYPGFLDLGLEDNTLEIRMTPPAAVSGTVQDSKGEPVAGAAVWVSTAARSPSNRTDGNVQVWAPLRSSLGRRFFAAQTETDGSFRISGLPADATLNLSAAKPGLALEDTPDAAFGPAGLNFSAGDSKILLAMKRAGSIEGRVVRADNNAPLAGARVSPQHSAWDGEAEPSPATSSDGIFRLTDLSAGSHVLQAVIGTNQFADWVCETITADVEAGKTNRDVKILASRGGVVEVTVRDESRGTPVAGASISASKGMEAYSAISSDEGVVRLRLVPGEYSLFATRAGFGNQQAQATVEPDQTNQVTVSLQPPAILVGTVLDPDGKPAPKVELSLFPAMQQRKRTDAEGHFSLNLAANRGGGMPDQQTVLIARDTVRNLAATQDLEDETTNATLRLVPGLTVAGRATDVDGKPITNAEAQLIFRTERMGTSFGSPVRANADGTFEIKALPRGRRYDVSVSAKGYGRKSVNLAPEETDLSRVQLDPCQLPVANQRIAGTVVDAEEKPVSGAMVYCYGTDQPGLNGRTDSKGQFAFNAVCAGSIQISANTGRGGGQSNYGNARAEAGDTNIVIQLGSSMTFSTSRSQRKIAGTVFDTDGKPAPKVKVSLFPSYAQGEKQTDAQGRFTLPYDRNQMGGRPDSQPVLLARDLARNLAVALDLDEDATNADLRLQPALTLAGRVTDVDGKTITAAQVYVLFWTANMGSSLGEPIKLSADGRFEFKGLPPGRRYGVDASAKGYGQESHTVEAADIETNRVELAPFQLLVADQRIAGVVLDDNDKPVARANIYSYGDKQPNLNAQTDAKGRFSLQPVCAGTLHLSVNAQAGGYANANVEGGDTNITIRLGSTSGSRAAAPPPATLKGKPLPDMTPLGLNATDLPADKPAIVLLLDAEQRPSRRALRLLMEQAPALKQKGVTVVVLQAGSMTDEALTAWKQEAAVPFPVGSFKAKPDSARTVWGAAAAPWLILADKDHRVVAEGFPLEELDAKLQSLNP